MSLLCRVGLHKYKSWTINSTGTGVEGTYIYTLCERCPKRKWKIIGPDKDSLYEQMKRYNG